MAEAAAGARLDAALLSVRDVMILASEDGTYSVTFSFNPWRFRKQMIRSIFSLRLTLENTVWPLTPGLWGSVCGLTALQVLTARKDSWWRSGWLANALWTWDSLFPWQNKLPTEIRLVWLSVLAGSLGVIGLSCIQRSILKLLLQYNGYMRLEHGQKPSKAVKVWFWLVKTLSGRKPATYNFQGVLPSLPVPPLKQTCENYLLTVKPLLSEKEFKEMEDLAQKFLKKDAWKLQLFLKLRSCFVASWLWSWWEKYVYLVGRDPIMINSNYYVLDSCWYSVTTNQAARAAALLHQAHQFKRMIDWQQLEPIMIQKTVPMCMKQYERIFDTTRIPGLECDTVVHYMDDPQRYVAVISKGVWYKLNMTIKGSKGIRACHAHELESQMAWILEDSAKAPAKPGDDSIAALTGSNRTRWAEARKQYFHEGVNKKSLSIIEKAMTIMVLDDKVPADLQEQSRMLMHGDGKTLWFDKSVSFITFPNGKAGIMAEHSYADALTVAHMWEWVTTGERLGGYSPDKSGHTIGWNDPKMQDPVVSLNNQRPMRLQWDLSPKAKEVIQQAVEDNKKLIEDLDLYLMQFDTYGKGFMKKARVSPDAFAQMAMQLAYKRDSGGKRALTYEASVTRLFRQGRTETVRALSIEAADFVDSMLDPKATNKARVENLRKAAEKHTTLYKDAMTGNGVDRHLFGLYVSSKYYQAILDFFKSSYTMDDSFLKAALRMPWTLSTSQTPQKQTEGRWNPEKEDADKISPGGGFGPVAEDGYGVSYQFASEDIMFFHISSKKRSPHTDSKRFAENIKQAMLDMRKMIEDAGKEGKEVVKDKDVTKSKV